MRLMLLEVTEGMPVVLKLRVRLPTVPLIDRLVKIAAPLALEVAVSVPPRVPPPEAIAAVTTIPLTGLFEASFTATTGCWANATPL